MCSSSLLLGILFVVSVSRSHVAPAAGSLPGFRGGDGWKSQPRALVRAKFPRGVVDEQGVRSCSSPLSSRLAMSNT